MLNVQLQGVLYLRNKMLTFYFLNCVLKETHSNVEELILELKCLGQCRQLFFLLNILQILKLFCFPYSDTDILDYELDPDLAKEVTLLIHIGPVQQKISVYNCDYFLIH